MNPSKLKSETTVLIHNLSFNGKWFTIDTFSIFYSTITCSLEGPQGQKTPGEMSCEMCSVC